MGKQLKLTNEELSNLLDIIKDFSNLNEKLDIETGRLEKIEQEHKQIINRVKNIEDSIESVRKRETEFIDSLREKYGEGKLNLETFEIEI